MGRCGRQMRPRPRTWFSLWSERSTPRPLPPITGNGAVPTIAAKARRTPGRRGLVAMAMGLSNSLGRSSQGAWESWDVLRGGSPGVGPQGRSLGPRGGSSGAGPRGRSPGLRTLRQGQRKEADGEGKLVEQPGSGCVYTEGAGPGVRVGVESVAGSPPGGFGPWVP